MSSGSLARPSAAFVRFAAVYARVRNVLAGGSVADVSESVIPLPHQRYALERAMETNFTHVISPIDAIKPIEERQGWTQEGWISTIRTALSP